MTIAENAKMPGKKVFAHTSRKKAHATIRMISATRTE